MTGGRDGGRDPALEHGLRIDFDAAYARIEASIVRTPLIELACDDERIELRAKLENRQVTGSFKARGALNQIASLGAAGRARGVVACSSGNHGKALAWAAGRAGVPATILMPDDAYPNKIEACREYGAEVVLLPGREPAESDCARLVEAGRMLVHPYDAERTIEGAGTVGLEIAEQWPGVEVVVFPVGGGGLIAGASLALRRRLGPQVRIIGVEPTGAPDLSRALAAGRPVALPEIRTRVQGLCPLAAGVANVSICSATVDEVVLLDDERILETQARLVRSGERVEPAGAAAVACIDAGRLPASWLAGRSARSPLRVCCVVSGGNADPSQLAGLTA